GGDRSAGEDPHDLRHRPSSADRAQRRPNHCSRRWPDRRVWHARGSHGARGALLPTRHDAARNALAGRVERSLEMSIRLMRTPDGLLSAAPNGRLVGPVRALRAVPLSDPDRYISIVDANDEEIAMISDLAEVDHETRRLLREELDRSYTPLTVQRINSARTE